jgi:hypothetical protein
MIQPGVAHQTARVTAIAFTGTHFPVLMAIAPTHKL